MPLLRLLAILGAALALAALGGCLPTDRSDPNTAYLPVKAIPSALPVDRLVQVSDSHIADLVAEGLFGVTEGVQNSPHLALRAAWVESGRLLRIELRRATYSDGTPVTPASVIAALERCMLSLEHEVTFALREVDGYQEFKARRAEHVRGMREAFGNSIEVRTVRPAPLLINDLSDANCRILKPGPSGTIDLLQGAVGTGPYVLTGREATEVTLTRRENYYGRNRGPEHVVFRQTNHMGDFSKLRDWSSLIVTEADPGETAAFNKFEFAELGTYQLIPNHSRPPFNKLAVRQALEAAIDFDRLARGMNWSRDRLQAGIFPFGMRGFRKRERLRDLDRAIQLLAREGYTDANPLKFTITISKSAISEREVRVWPSVFEGAPIEARVELLPHAELVKKRNAAEFEALRIIKYPGRSEAQRLLAAYLSTSKWNTPRAQLPECDKLISRVLQTGDAEQRQRIYLLANDCLMLNALLVPLSSIQPGVVLVRKPWRLNRSNPYLLYPYLVSDWFAADESK